MNWPKIHSFKGTPDEFYQAKQACIDRLWREAALDIAEAILVREHLNTARELYEAQATLLSKFQTTLRTMHD